MITFATEFKSDLTNAARFAESKVVSPEICLRDSNKQAFITAVSEALEEYPLYIGYNFVWQKASVKLSEMTPAWFTLDGLESGESHFDWAIAMNNIFVKDQSLMSVALKLVEKFSVDGVYTATNK